MLKRVNTAVSVAAASASAIVGDAKMIETMKINPKLLSKTSLLVHLWGAISYPTDTIEETDFVLRDYQLTRYDVEGLTKHFQACKDCAAEGVFLMATQNDEGYDVLRLSNMPCDLLTDDGDDDGWGAYEQDEAVVASEQVDTRPIFPVESDDEVIIIDTKNWVQKVIADFAVCPFTVDPDRAGIPMGGVRYSVSRATSADEAFYRYWEEVMIVLQTPERAMATVLLVFPEIELFGNYELFEAFCDSLQDALSKSALNLETEIQLVFFHPRFQFRDGQARSGSTEGAPNYARRGPWPMINILRTPQVRAAQKGVPTGVVYKQNEERLNAVGAKVLQDMLYNRDWTGLPIHSMASKTTRKTQDSDAYNPVNVLDPILTSLSSDKQLRPSMLMCPMSPSLTTTDISSPTDISSGDDSGAVKKCPIDHTSSTVEAIKDDDDNGSSLSSLPSPLSTTIDYLKLAEDVDKWLESQ